MAQRFSRGWNEVPRIVHDIVHEFGGSISAEHGIGVMKRDELSRYKSAGEIDVMRALKRTLDPKNILNPGKVICTLSRFAQRRLFGSGGGAGAASGAPVPRSTPRSAQPSRRSPR